MSYILTKTCFEMGKKSPVFVVCKKNEMFPDTWMNHINLLCIDAFEVDSLEWVLGDDY